MKAGIVSVTGVVLLALASSVSAETIFLRGSSHTFSAGDDDKGDPELHGTISFVVPTPFGLTAGQSFVLPVQGIDQARSYRIRGIDGIELDVAAGQAFGTPLGAVGASYSLIVEALGKDGAVLASTEPVVRTFRDPLAVATRPSDLSLSVDDDLPAGGTVAVASGGDASTTTWSLAGAPSWLSIAADGRLAMVPGEPVETSERRTVTVSARDAEGRGASASFGVAVRGHGPVEVSRDVPFALTVGVPVQLDVAGLEPNFTYRLATAVPGLAFDVATGKIVGTPTGVSGTSYPISLEAVSRRDRVVATSPAVDRVLRDPLVVASVPKDILRRAGNPLPSTNVTATATGGDQESVGWSLSGAPDWLRIDQGGKLVIVDGRSTEAGSSVRVGVTATDDEGRTDSDEGFDLEIRGALRSTEILAPDRAAEDRFSYAIDIDGDFAVVGSYLDDVVNAQGTSLTNAGSVYVFRRSGSSWNLFQHLKPSDMAANDYFGGSVAISGGTIVVGSFLDDDGGKVNSGSAYVYDLNPGGTAWVQRAAKLHDPQAAASDQFGWAAAISGDMIAVSARYSDLKGINSGSVTVFDRAGTVIGHLVAGAGAANDNMGWAVTIAGSTVLAGAPTADTGGMADSGAVHAFDRSGSTWTESVIVPTGLTANDRFGVSLSGDGDMAVIGAPLHASAGSGSGVAHVFRRSGAAWNQTASLVSGDIEAGDQFGQTVAMSGDRMVVSAVGDDDRGSASGSAYAFERNGSDWVETAKVVPSELVEGDRMGLALAMSGSSAIVGSYVRDAGISDAGSAFVIDGF